MSRQLTARTRRDLLVTEPIAPVPVGGLAYVSNEDTIAWTNDRVCVRMGQEGSWQEASGCSSRVADCRALRYQLAASVEGNAMAAKTQADLTKAAGRTKPRVPASALALLESARLGLQRCGNDPSPATRLVESQLAALRTAAAVVAVRSDPRTISSNEGPRSLWDVLPDVAPGLCEWARYFAVSPKRRGGRALAWWHRASLRREADEFQLNVEKFFALAVDALGVAEEFGVVTPPNGA